MNRFKASSFCLHRALSPLIRHTRPPLSHLRQMSRTPSTQANAHWSSDHNGKPVVDLTFIEEPLGILGEDGYGWPFIDFGESVGPDGRYVISRKLGFGSTSSVWPARDQRSVFSHIENALVDPGLK